MVQTNDKAQAAGVLIVEADSAIRELVTRALSAEGYRALGLPDVALALDHLAGGEPRLDAVLLDPRLPGASGEAFAARYGRLPEPRPSLLVFTTSPAVEAARMAEALGAAGFVTKPFDLGVLLDVVGRCVAARPAPRPQRPQRPGRQTPAPRGRRRDAVGMTKEAAAAEVRRRRLTLLRNEVGRIREELPRLQEALQELSLAESQRRLSAAEAQQVTTLRQRSEALRLELGLFRDEFERLRAPS
jgi:DNA-binding NtrC family response regulator